MIGAIGYFHSQLKATYEIIKNYRHFYPSNSLVMINDAGREELKDIAKLFQASYHPYTKNLTTGNNVDDINVMIEWLKRFFKAVKEIKEPHFIILEDDVIIIQSINLSDFTGEMYGYNSNALLPEKVTEYLKNYNSSIQTSRVCYGGCGGCIMNTKFFNEIGDRDWETEIKKYGELSQRYSPNEQSWYFNDCCISFLCWRFGGTIVQNKSWGDLNQAESHEKYKNGKLTIGHQYREHFNKPYQTIHGNIHVL